MNIFTLVHYPFSFLLKLSARSTSVIIYVIILSNIIIILYKYTDNDLKENNVEKKNEMNVYP